MPDGSMQDGVVEWTSQAEVALVALVVTVTFYLISRRADRSVRRAELIRAFTSDFYSSPELIEIFAEIDALPMPPRNLAQIDDRSLDELIGTARESNLVRLLDYLNTVGNAYVRGVLPLGDLAGTTVGYMTFRTWHDPLVQRYLARVTRHDLESGYVGSGFQQYYALAYGLARWSMARGGRAWDYQVELFSRWRLRSARFRRHRPVGTVPSARP